ncbi:hypothetical protein MPSEU_000891500 [Mayamaea pseudoterrestris]|nr:hypothetical protein MPSEU_000891500 [Mayamaea pseudoterrestris]
MNEDDLNRLKATKGPKRSRRRESSDDDHSTSSSRDHRKKKSHKRSKSKTIRAQKKKDKKKHHRKHFESFSSDSSSLSDTESSSEDGRNNGKKDTVVNERLLAKLKSRGETMEERRERRAQKRAAHIASAFGYTADNNPFNDPNLHEAFTWKKKKEKVGDEDGKAIKIDDTLSEIEKVRQRRKDRDEQIVEMERIRAEESRMRELENADEWERKEEEFHLQQQRQRSAIRLVEGRERPIDVLAKNMLVFGLSDEEKKNRAAVKYKEKYNAMEAVESLEAEMEPPYSLLQKLKLEELHSLLVDVEAFQVLEATTSVPSAVVNKHSDTNTVLEYWKALNVVAQDEINFLKSGGAKGSHASMVSDVQKIFAGQSAADLTKMQSEVVERIKSHAADAEFDLRYWKFVLEQLVVHLAKSELADMHNKMLARQLEHLEMKRAKLAANLASEEDAEGPQNIDIDEQADGLGEMDEEFGSTEELQLVTKKYSWQDKYRPRKPRYFNRVRSGWDWNKYNQVHFDKDNPPPKVVQGYKFNLFYPDLIDPSKTPTFFLERADSDDFCIIRFHAGPPYEDVAFKIINREWNRSRKRGYKCSFERGVLSLYFNFKSHWYRR